LTFREEIGEGKEQGIPRLSAGAHLCKIEDLGQTTLYTHMLRQGRVYIKTGKMTPKIYKFQAPPSYRVYKQIICPSTKNKTHGTDAKLKNVMNRLVR
jgi:hypothetical protein